MLEISNLNRNHDQMNLEFHLRLTEKNFKESETNDNFCLRSRMRNEYRESSLQSKYRRAVQL